MRRRLLAIIKERCPRCLQGRVFAGTLRMNKQCPHCQHVFEREPGYFLGAMYVSYFLSIPILGLLTFLIYWFVLPNWAPHWVVFVALIPYIVFIPPVFRYSRVIWMHIDPPPC